MHAIWTIARRDLIHFFSTPLAWLVLAVWSALVGFSFYAGGLAPAHGGGGSLEPLFVTSLQIGAMVLTLLAPAITMNSFASERADGTMQLLLTVPIREWQLVVGKFLATWGMLLSLLAATLIQPGLLLFVSDPGGWQLGAGYIGMALYCAFLAALGNWISLLVDSPVAAYVISFGALAVFQILSQLANHSSPVIGGIGEALGIMQRVGDCIAGDIRLGHLVWLIGGCAIWLILTHASLMARRVHG